MIPPRDKTAADHRELIRDLRSSIVDARKILSFYETIDNDSEYARWTRDVREDIVRLESWLRHIEDVKAHIDDHMDRQSKIILTLESRIHASEAEIRRLEGRVATTTESTRESRKAAKARELWEIVQKMVAAGGAGVGGAAAPQSPAPAPTPQSGPTPDEMYLADARLDDEPF